VLATLLFSVKLKISTHAYARETFDSRVKSVLARHYTDYCPERLERIYDKANLRILN